MIQLMRQHNQREYYKIQEIFNFLQKDFFIKYDSIPHRFCHGDYHPLNIIWSNQSIQSVIDWEFLGLKPEIYDCANLLGCLGIEEPTALIKGFSLTFIDEIKKSNLLSEIGLHYLFECIMALRFAWLAEWFRKKDVEMINLEITYMHLLMKNKGIIKEKWNLP